MSTGIKKELEKRSRSKGRSFSLPKYHELGKELKNLRIKFNVRISEIGRTIDNHLSIAGLAPYKIRCVNPEGANYIFDNNISYAAEKTSLDLNMKQKKSERYLKSESPLTSHIMMSPDFYNKFFGSNQIKSELGKMLQGSIFVHDQRKDYMRSFSTIDCDNDFLFETMHIDGNLKNNRAGYFTEFSSMDSTRKRDDFYVHMLKTYVNTEQAHKIKEIQKLQNFGTYGRAIRFGITLDKVL